MSVTYGAFRSNLKIKGTTKITSLWDIRITNVTSGKATGSAKNTIAPTWDKLTANMEADLYEKGDSMEYDVTITNNGTVDAVLSDIIGTPSNKEAVIITYSGYAKGEKLYKKGQTGSEKIVHVKIAYNPEYNGGETSGESNIEFNFKQGEGGDITPDDNKYLLTYNYTYNGGLSSETHDEYIEKGTTVDLNKSASKPGWTFVGWNTNKDAQTGLPNIKVEDTTTVYAIYSKKLTATYEKGEHVENISKETDTCTIYNLQTSCTKTLPVITPSAGYTVDTWYNGNTEVGKSGNSYELKSDITLTTKAVINKYLVTYNYSENGGNSATKTEDNVAYGKDIDLTPTATKLGWTFIGWNTNKDATVALENLKMGTENVTLYAIYKKEAITLKAKFNGNGSTLSSTEDVTCTIPAVFNKETQITSCEVDAPTITAPTNTPTVIGFNVTSGSTTNNSSYDTTTKKITLTEGNNNNTWYAITTKAKINRTITFYRNSNTNFIYNGTTYTGTSKSITVCTIPAVYNGAAQATSCTATITMPTITAPANTPTINGYSSGATTYSNYWTHNTAKAVSADASWYAQTSKAEVTHTVTFNKNGASTQTNASGTAVTDNSVTRTCTREATHNGTAQAASCSITSPTIAAASGFTVVGYNTSATATTSTWDQNTEKTDISADATYNAITKSSAAITITFNKNGATSQTPSGGSASTATTVTQSCYRYNGASTCNITSPTITRSGFTITGYGTAKGSTTSAWNVNTSKAVSANKTYYAVTSKLITVTFAKGANTSAIGSTGTTCTIQNNKTNCTAATPTITSNTGYLYTGWSTTNGEVNGTLPGNNVTVSANTTYYGNSMIGTPTFTEAVDGEVTITYPRGCTAPYECKYRVGDGADVSVSTDSITVPVGEDDIITATANETTNTTSSTYSVIRNGLYVSSTGNDTTGYGTVLHPYATIARAYQAATTTPVTSTIYVMDNITHSSKATMASNKDIVLTSCTKSGSTCPYSSPNTVLRGTALTDNMITLSNGTLTLNNITVDGNGSNVEANSMINLTYGSSELTINSGTVLKNSFGDGAIRTESDVIMNGGTITNNSAMGDENTYTGYGGAIQIEIDGSFTLNDGSISNNAARVGGAIYASGTVNINGGTISGNTASKNAGAVAIYDGTGNMSGGTISGNRATGVEGYGNGGAIDVVGSQEYTIFRMTGGTLSNNEAKNGGAITHSGKIELTGGTITNNKASESTAAGGIANIGSVLIVGGTLNLSDNLSNVTADPTNGNVTTNNIWNSNTNPKFTDQKGNFTINDFSKSYKVLSKANENFGMHVYASSSTVGNNSNVDIYTYSSATQVNVNWEFYPDTIENGVVYYYIEPKLDYNYHVSNINDSSENGNSVKLYTKNTHNAQRWKLTNQGTNYYSIVSHSGKCMDIKNGTMSNNTDIQIYTCNQTNAQIWKLVAI